MKTHLLLLWLVLAPLFCFAQVGIGTTTPNPKSLLDLSSTNQGFLVPRMTGLQKSELGLTTNDIGMMVFQTDIPQAPLTPTPKGLYYFDGVSWIVPLQNGTANGETIRWDGTKWVSGSNLFNQGSSIGIGTTSPKAQLHIHSNGTPTSRLQITSGNGNANFGDGLLIGMTLTNLSAHIIQQENRPLLLGTNGVERVRIDSVGNLGIGKTNPEAKLDVNGSFKLGASGSIINNIIKTTIDIMVPAMESMHEDEVDIPLPNVLMGATVYVSPAAPMSGLMIGYAMVSEDSHVQVKFMNMGDTMDDPMPLTLHVTVIQ